LDAKKKTLHAAERDAALRATWHLDVALNLDPADLVSVDEVGVSLALTRAYARAPRGERAIGRVPRNHGTPTSVIAALTPTGISAALSRLGAIDTAAVRVFVRDLLAPTLRPGQVVLFDNLTAHHDPQVRAMIEAKECVVAHLPTYSPDFAPIEPAFAKFKAMVRQIAARTQQALDQAITTGLDSITAEDARGFFNHCGYPLPAESSCSPL
jgi:transposase